MNSFFLGMNRAIECKYSNGRACVKGKLVLFDCCDCEDFKPGCVLTEADIVNPENKSKTVGELLKEKREKSWKEDDNDGA